ncbi:MAG: DUF6687 family protein [Gammaproteobacteria bacterium]
MPATAASTSPASLPVAPQFVPYTELGDRPNVIVDGPPQKATELTLSHWPNNQTPDELKRDTSTAIAFAYLDRPDLHRDIGAISNSHFDEDGLFSMFALVHPATALAYRELLIDASRAGDFGIFEQRDAARLAFTIEAFADPTTSPLPADTFAVCDRRRAARLYTAMLEVLPGILDDLPGHKVFWESQDAHLEASLRRLADGTVQIQEISELDLAIVRIPEALTAQRVSRYLQTESAVIHPFAIHQSTQCNRLLRIQARRYEFQYRYESWVQLASRRPALRVDLVGLADALNACETAPGTWCAEPVTDVAPRCYLDGVDASALSDVEFIDLLSRYLRESPIAWDPYDWEA